MMHRVRICTAEFEQENLVRRFLQQPVGENAPRCAGTNDDVIV